MGRRRERGKKGGGKRQLVVPLPPLSPVKFSSSKPLDISVLEIYREPGRSSRPGHSTRNIRQEVRAGPGRYWMGSAGPGYNKVVATPMI